MQGLAFREAPAPSVAIVLLNFNGLEDTRRCLGSIERVAYRPLLVIAVDNGSQEDPTEILRREFPWCVVIRSESNEGWAGGNNIGIRHALREGAEYVIVLNNDTVVSEELVDRLVHAALGHPEFGIIGPVINDMEHPDQVQTDGCLFNRPDASGFFDRKPVPLDRCSPPSITGVDIVNGCCMMISRSVFDMIGLFDERFFLIHEESDFCLRAHEAGFYRGVVGEALVWHKHSASFARAGNWRQRYYDVRNLFLLLRTHPANHLDSRSKYQSWLAYLKHVYYSYCLEREHQSKQGTRAVVQGLCDAFSGHFGPYAERDPLGFRLIQGLLEAGWKLRGSKAAGTSSPQRHREHGVNL
ncbi:MAG: glycosyltransferase family 2 protein [Syntrophobacteraceae bacterium]